MFDVHAALRQLVAEEGSDLHLKVGSPPLYRVQGSLGPDSTASALSAEDTEHALHELLHDQVKLKEFTDDHEVDFSFEIEGLARFRVNAFRQRGRHFARLQGHPRQDLHDR